MEKWNLYDREGNLTERIHTRGQPLPENYYHLVVHIWLIDSHGRHLIQKRAKSLKSQPGCWAFTGGSAIVGESSLQAVRRETMEELNLKLPFKDLCFQTRLWRQSHFLDIWSSPIDAVFPKGFEPTTEVEAVTFKSTDEILQMIDSQQFYSYPQDYLSLLKEKRKTINHQTNNE